MSIIIFVSQQFLAALRQHRQNRLAFVLGALFVASNVGAATRTISNAGGNWNALGTWVEGAVPLAADDVVATATSGNMTINVAAACRSFNLTNYVNTVTHAAAVTLTIGDATAGTGSNALVFPAAGWTYTKGNNTTSAVSFVTTSGTQQTVNFGDKAMGNVTFNGAGAVWATTGAQTGTLNTTTLTNGTIRVNNAGAFGSGPITFNGAVTLDNTSGSAITLSSNNAQNWNSNFSFTGTDDLTTGTGAVAMNATRTLTINGGQLAVRGIISGVTFGITKAGAGALVLSGANTFTGATTLSAGTLRATTAVGALGAGTLSLNGGTLELANDTALNFARNTTIGGTATIVSDRLTSGAAVTHTLGTLSIGNRILNINPGSNVASGTAGLTFGATTLSASTPVFDVDTGTLLTLGALTGNFNIVKQDTGQLTLGAASTKTGGSTTLAAGTLRLGATSALGTAAATLILNGGTLDIAANTTINAYPTTVGGNVNIIPNRLTAGVGVTHTLGTLSLGAFTLSAEVGANVTSGSQGITFGATTLTGDPTFDVLSSVAPAVPLTMTLGAVTDGAAARTITKSNTGVLTFGSAATSLINGTQIDITGGQVNSNNATAIGSLATLDIAIGGTFRIGANQAVTTVVNAGVVSLQGFTLTLGGDWTNTGTLTHANGPVVFSGAVNHQVDGSTSFHTLRCTVSGATVTFAAGSTSAITNTVDFQNVSLLSGTDNVAWNLEFTGGSQTLFNVSVKDSDASAGSQMLPTIGIDLGNNVNWAWTRDLTLSQNTINFGSLAASAVTVIATAITVTNTGNTTQSYEVSISNPADWTATAGAPGTDQFRLTALFRTALPASADFSTANDVVTTSPVTSSATVLARDADPDAQKGFNVLPGETRSLWFRVEMPPTSTTTDPQVIALSALAL